MTGILDIYWRLISEEFDGLRHAMGGSVSELFESVAVYAFIMSMLWTSSSLIYWVRSQWRKPATMAPSRSYSVLIPFHGEPLAALNSARSPATVSPAPEEIILIDDGSPVGVPPGTVLPPRTRLLRLDRRRGKAGALNEALRTVYSDIVVCLDADTTARSTDWRQMLASFDDSSLGAITGKIWPLAPGSLIGRFQQLDYLAVITVIKAAETVWGGLLTVSGAVVAYRLEALRAVGGWREDKAAEDIDISWRMQCNGWRLAFDNTWKCAVEMAPTAVALWRQRRRWSTGLGQAMRDYGVSALVHGARHLPVVVITIANIIWISSVLFIAGNMAFVLAAGGWTELSWVWDSNLLLATEVGFGLFFCQFIVAMMVDGRTWRNHIALVPFLPFYAIYFWLILVTSFVVGFPNGFIRKRLGIWQPTVRQRQLDQ